MDGSRPSRPFFFGKLAAGTGRTIVSSTVRSWPLVAASVDDAAPPIKCSSSGDVPTPTGVPLTATMTSESSTCRARDAGTGYHVGAKQWQRGAGRVTLRAHLSCGRAIVINTSDDKGGGEVGLLPWHGSESGR